MSASAESRRLPTLATRWLGRELHWLPRTGSTNDDVLARAREGARPGLVILADEQTRGRGRLGRAWHSPPEDNLYLSLLARPPASPQLAPPLTLAAAVAVCDTLAAAGCAATIKWPNDLLIGGKKVAGILTESTTRDGRLEAVVIGVGINVNGEPPPELAAIATSMRLALGSPVDRARLAADLLARLEEWLDRYQEEGAAPVIEAWKRRTQLLGRRVRVVVDGASVIGRARDVDREGALLIDSDAGRELRVLAGEVTLVPEAGS